MTENNGERLNMNHTIEQPISPRPRPTTQTTPKKEVWRDYIAPIFCCFAKKEGYEEIGPETVEQMAQRIQDLYNIYDRLNDQLQSVQSSSEMQRILQERLVEQVHETDDLISNNKSELLTELQDVADREAFNRDDLRETIIRYLEEERLKEIEDVLTGHSNNSAQMVEQIISTKSKLSALEDNIKEMNKTVIQHQEQLVEREKVEKRLSTCENRAGIGEYEKTFLMEEVKLNSSFMKEKEETLLQRITSLEQTNELLLSKLDTGEDSQKQVDAVFISRLADSDREQAILKSKFSNIESKMETLCTRGYVENLVRSLEEDRNSFITKSVERAAAFHIEQSKKELAQRQASRIGEIEGKLEGLRVLVTGLVKSVEIRDAQMTQMNKSYFNELQKHVDDTSEELRKTFAEFKVVKRNFEEQHRRMSTVERTMERVGDEVTIEEDIHVLAKKLDRLESRVEQVVDKVVELGDRSPSPELDDLARLKRDLRKGTKPLNPSTARRRNNSSTENYVVNDEEDVPGTSTYDVTVGKNSSRRNRQLSGLGEKSSLKRAL